MKTTFLIVATILVSGLSSGSARAGDFHDSQGAFRELSPLACRIPIHRARQVYADDLYERRSIAEALMSGQAEALKKLGEKIAADRAAIHRLMSTSLADTASADSNARERVYRHEARYFLPARQAIEDQSCAGFLAAQDQYGVCRDAIGQEVGVHWARTVKFGVETYAGGYGVQVCTESNPEGKYGRLLKVCAVLDVESGVVWGQSWKEALQLGQSYVEPNDALFAQLAKDAPVCLEAAGFRAGPDGTKIVEHEPPKSAPAAPVSTLSLSSTTGTVRGTR